MKCAIKTTIGLFAVSLILTSSLVAGSEQEARPELDIIYNTTTRTPKIAGVTEFPPTGSATRYYKKLVFSGERQTATGPVINHSTNSAIAQTRDMISGYIVYQYNATTDNIDVVNNTQHYVQTINTPAPWPYETSWPAPSPFPLGFSITVAPSAISYEWYNDKRNPLNLAVKSAVTAGDNGEFNYGIFGGNTTTPTEWIHDWQMELQEEDTPAAAEARAKISRVFNQENSSGRTSIRGTMGTGTQWTIREVEVRYHLRVKCPGDYVIKKTMRKRLIGTQTWEAPWDELVTVTVREGGGIDRSFNLPLIENYEVELTFLGVVRTEGCAVQCAASHAGSGSGPVNGSIYWPLPLGLMGDGQSAGMLMLHAAQIAAETYSPAVLKVALAGGAGPARFDAQGHLRQILVPEALVDVVVSATQAYELRFYERSQAGEVGQDGLQTPSGNPYVVWRIENPDASGSTTNRLKVTRIIGSNELVTEIDESQAGTRIFSEANGLRVTEVVQTTESGERVERITVRNDLAEVASVTKKYYHQFAWGEELTKEILDPDGAALTTVWTYGTTAGTGGYRQILTKTLPSGFVHTYNYDSAGRQYNQTAPLWKNGTRTLSYQNAGFSDLNADGIPDQLIQIFDQSGQIRLSNEFIVNWGSTNGTSFKRTHYRARNSSAAWNNSANIVTQERFDAAGNLTYRLSPDGTLLTVTRATDGNGVTTVVERQGVASGDNESVVDGTNRTQLYTPKGQLISTLATDIVSGLVLESLQVMEADNMGRATRLVHTDGAEEQRTYCTVCSQIESTTLRGETVSYEFDGLGRKTLETRLAGSTVLARTRYKYDAEGRLRQAIRLDLQSSAETVLNSVTYDLAGRLIAETAIGQGGTTYGYQFGTSNATITTTTYADGGTWIETRAASGDMISIRGTAVPHFDYDYAPIEWYGGDGYYFKIYARHEDNTTTLEQHAMNMLGLPYSISLPGSATITRTLDSKGRLVRVVDPDGVTAITAYDAFGRPAIRAVDMDADNLIDYDGSDRLTRTLYAVAERNGVVVRRTSNQIWETNGQDTPTTVSIQEQGVDGLHTWTTVNGLETATVIAYDNAGGHTVTITAPDGTVTVHTYLGDRLTGTTVTSVTATQLSHTVYSHDSNGRLQQVADVRNGTTTYTYDAQDRIETVTTPDPDSTRTGVGYDPQVTSYGYDSMGRVTTVPQPDGAVQNTSYYPTGKVKRVWGARLYPVEYTYTLQNRLKTMTTWQDFAGETGQAVTTWNTSNGRGWLNNKRYADNTGPSYTHKFSGRLLTRTWARGVSATFAYNAAGELTGINYSDSTPDITLTLDRTGRPVTITDGAGTRTITYHMSGQLDAEAYTAGAFANLAVDHSFDSFHHISGVSIPSLYGADYGYDAASRLETITAGTNTATYAYVPNSPLVETVTFKQSGATRLTTTKSYDNLNRLALIGSQVSGPSTQVSAAYTYNAANQRTRATREDDAYWAYEYDALGQVTAGKKHLADATPVNGLDYAWTYDDIGNRKTAVINSQTATYTTNTLNQYSQRTVPGVVDVLGAALATATVTLTMEGGPPQATDRQGELFHQQLAVNNAGAAQTPEIGILAVQNNAGPAGEDLLAQETRSPFVARTSQSFSYDADGNLTADTRWTYTWDAENRLVAMEATAAAVTAGVAKQKLEFAYDGQSRRIAKKVYDWNGTAWVLAKHTLFLHDGWNMIAELDALAGNAVTRTYVWGLDLSGSQQGAGGVGGLLFTNSHLPTASSHAAAYDGNGNVIALVDMATGVQSGTYDYNAFGETIIIGGAAAMLNPYRFSTKYTDLETGLLYYGLRYYNPRTGRWQSRDPFGERGGENMYQFCSNSAISAIDPLGQAVYLSTRPLELPGGKVAACADLVHVYLAFDMSDLTTEEQTEWVRMVAESNDIINIPQGVMKPLNQTVPYQSDPLSTTFSFHPYSVATGGNDLNHSSTIDTYGSYIAYNASIDQQALTLSGAGYEQHLVVVGNFQLQAKIYRSAIQSRNINNSSPTAVDPARYQFPTCNCGSWATTILKRNGIELPAELMNLGVGLGRGLGRTPIPGMITIIGEGLNPGRNPNGGVNILKWKF